MNKKLSELTEKITSLSADDLLYVSAGGVSKSIKASTIEAPLKAYADQKKSEVITEIEVVEANLADEIADRIAADASNLAIANSYADQKKSEVVSSLNSEISRATAAESELSSRIDAILSNVDASSLDSLSELMSAFQSADSNLNSSITALATELASDLSEEITNRTSADSANLVEAKAYADQKKSEVQLLISDVADDLSSEISARSAANFTTLQLAKSYTDDSLADFVPPSSNPVGSMLLFAGSVAPTGYLLCDGSSISRTTYSALFSVIGTNFGSASSTTFNLPNPDVNANLKYIIKF
jgi:hypothetical protein